MGVSPGATLDWKNSIPSSAGVFGVLESTGLVWDEFEVEFEPLRFGMATEGFDLA